jgi:hypothetical protein
VAAAVAAIPSATDGERNGTERNGSEFDGEHIGGYTSKSASQWFKVTYYNHFYSLQKYFYILGWGIYYLYPYLRKNEFREINAWIIAIVQVCIVRPKSTGLHTWPTSYRIRDGVWPTLYTSCTYS